MQRTAVPGGGRLSRLTLGLTLVGGCLREAPAAAPADADLEVKSGNMPQPWLAARGVTPLHMSLYGNCPSAVFIIAYAVNDRPLTSIITVPGRFTFYPPDAPALRLRYGCDFDGDGTILGADVATIDPWYPYSPTGNLLQLPAHDADPAYPLSDAKNALTRPRVANDVVQPQALPPKRTTLPPTSPQ